MKLIPLTQGLFAQVDDEDYDYLNQFKWHAVKNKNTFYAQKGRTPIIKMHRLIMRTPDGIQVDHIDHNGLNNQKCNLRNCTEAQNLMNRTPHGKSKYSGVSFVCKKYKGKNHTYIQASITANKKNHFLGHFNTVEDAARARDVAAKKYFGEFANLNFK